MTLNQVKEIIGTSDMDKWIDLGEKFKYILLVSDRTMFCHGSSVRFYFSSTENYLLIRNLNGKLIPVEQVSDPIGYESFSYKGNDYYIKAFGGGKDYSSAGNYHDIISYDSITGFFKI
jgi:hypothetical protein